MPDKNNATSSGKSILVVGFEPKDKINYPHLFAVMAMLGNEARVDYFHFRERGYFITDFFTVTLGNIVKLKPLRVMFRVFVDFLRLRKAAKQFDRIVVIDNFSYIFCCFCHDNVILWSHDFVTQDQPRSKTFIQRQIAAMTRKCLKKNGKLIIQSKERQDLFLQSIQCAVVPECYLLPVSLPRSKTENIPVLSNKKPVLMQIGGINAFRSDSDKLIQAYQSQASAYSLLLHGYFSVDILGLLKTVDVVPLCSMIDVKPGAMGQLISHCDIGFISYRCTDSNFYFISHASGQLAEFLCQGKPVLASGNTNLKEFVEKMGIGVFVEDLQGIPSAVERIMKNYESYSTRSYELFLATYCLDTHKQQLTRWIQG